MCLPALTPNVNCTGKTVNGVDKAGRFDYRTKGIMSACRAGGPDGEMAGAGNPKKGLKRSSKRLMPAGSTRTRSDDWLREEPVL